MNRCLKIPGTDERLRFLIDEKFGGNVTHFCRACGLTKSSFYERRGHSLRLVYKVAATTHCSLDWLIFGKGDPFK